MATHLGTFQWICWSKNKNKIQIILHPFKGRQNDDPQFMNQLEGIPHL